MFKRLLIFVLPVLLLASTSMVFAKGDKQVNVYYFYGKPRCVTCKKIEQYTKEAVIENFSKEIKAKKVAFKGIDYDNPKNRHYLKDYKLFTKSVIVSETKNGKEITYKNLNKIWTLTNNEKNFKDYIKKEINSSIKE
jgi:arsenate reductase-like glutaredoxin family protein